MLILHRFFAHLFLAFSLVKQEPPKNCQEHHRYIQRRGIVIAGIRDQRRRRDVEYRFVRTNAFRSIVICNQADVQEAVAIQINRGCRVCRVGCAIQLAPAISIISVDIPLISNVFAGGVNREGCLMTDNSILIGGLPRDDQCRRRCYIQCCHTGGESAAIPIRYCAAIQKAVIG